MVKCMVLNCTNYAGKKSMTDTIKFHRFPKDPKLCAEWAKVCRKNINTKNDSVCSDHFEESDYQLKDILLNIPLNKRRLKGGAIPTINLGLATKKPSGRKRTKEKQIKKRLIEEAMSCYERSIENDCTEDFSSQTSESSERKWLLTELIVEPISSLGCIDENEDDLDNLPITAEKCQTTERIAIIEEKTPSTSDLEEDIQSKKRKKKTTPATKKSAQQTHIQEKCRTPAVTESATQTQHPEQIDKAVQTEIDYEVALEFRIIKAEDETRKLKSVLNKAVKERQRKKAKEEHLRKIFTPGQLKRLREPDKNFRWSDEDQIAARDLYLAGIRTYEILRNRGFPLPGSSTYRNWAAKSKRKPKSQAVPETEVFAADESIPASASEHESLPDSELDAALESISKPEHATESEIDQKAESVKQSSIQMYWNEFMDTIA